VEDELIQLYGRSVRVCFKVLCEHSDMFETYLRILSTFLYCFASVRWLWDCTIMEKWLGLDYGHTVILFIPWKFLYRKKLWYEVY